MKNGLHIYHAYLQLKITFTSVTTSCINFTYKATPSLNSKDIRIFFNNFYKSTYI